MRVFKSACIATQGTQSASSYCQASQLKKLPLASAQAAATLTQADAAARAPGAQQNHAGKSVNCVLEILAGGGLRGKAASAILQANWVAFE